MKSSKGFMLIETVVAAAVMSVFLTVMFEMLIMFKGIYDRGESDVEIQENAQILQQFVETRMQLCSQMINVRTEGEKAKSWSEFEGGEIQKIRFKLETIEGEIYINSDTKKLFYRTDFSSPGYEFADYVSSMRAYKVDGGRGIRMVFRLERENCSMDVDFTVYFRNV